MDCQSLFSGKKKGEKYSQFVVCWVVKVNIFAIYRKSHLQLHTDKKTGVNAIFQRVSLPGWVHFLTFDLLVLNINRRHFTISL